MYCTASDIYTKPDRSAGRDKSARVPDRPMMGVAVQPDNNSEE